MSLINTGKLIDQIPKALILYQKNYSVLSKLYLG